MPDAFESQTIDELLQHLASSKHGSPGAGSAAAIGLALGCACLVKAIDVSILHGPPAPGLTEARPRLIARMKSLVEAAAQDASTFAAYLEDPGRGTTQRLLTAESGMVASAAEVLEWVGSIEPHIHPTMQGDVFAAQTLASAARAICGRNLRETHDSA